MRTQENIDIFYKIISWQYKGDKPYGTYLVQESNILVISTYLHQDLDFLCLKVVFSVVKKMICLNMQIKVLCLFLWAGKVEIRKRQNNSRNPKSFQNSN